MKTGKTVCAFVMAAIWSGTIFAGLPETIVKVKPSIVAVGTIQYTRSPPAKILGTGFAVGNGQYVVTNHHVIPENMDVLHNEELAIFAGIGDRANIIKVKVVQTDEAHDLALLKFSGKPLPSLQLGNGGEIREGQEYASTGFPIGAILGLYPVTHHGIISAITPIAIPVRNSKQLDINMIQRLQHPYNVYQLDATAYPGNSGSPVYSIETGHVIGVINKVFVQETKESLLEKPSGISYAIPAEFVRDLLKKAGLGSQDFPAKE